MNETTDPKRMTPYELCVFIVGKRGSLSDIAKEIGRSKAYVSILKKIERDGAAMLIAAWSRGDVPFDLVREIVRLGRDEQKGLTREYLLATKGKNKQARSEARATVLAAVGRV